MAYYRCAMMEVETKFKVLSEELALEYDHNPIETIKTRLKEPEAYTKQLYIAPLQADLYKKLL